MVYPTKIIVIRHGEAENNVRDILSSSTENVFHLTEAGRKQIAKSAEEISSHEKIDFIFASPIKRALETAQILSHQCGVPENSIRIDSRLREPHFGEMEERPYAEYVKCFKNKEDRFLKAVPGGESGEEVFRRINDFFDEIKSNPKYEGKTLLLATHSFTMCQIHRYFTGKFHFPKPAEYLIYSLRR